MADGHVSISRSRNNWLLCSGRVVRGSVLLRIVFIYFRWSQERKHILILKSLPPWRAPHTEAQFTRCSSGLRRQEASFSHCLPPALPSLGGFPPCPGAAAGWGKAGVHPRARGGEGVQRVAGCRDLLHLVGWSIVALAKVQKGGGKAASFR